MYLLVLSITSKAHEPLNAVT